MRKNQIFHYYVEGENEKKLVNTLKTNMKLIYPGKVTVLNVVEQKITKRKLMELNPGTNVVLVFDTDTESSKILEDNIALIEKQSFVKNVYCVTQVKNLEDEIKRSCKVKDALEFTGTKTLSDHKKKFNQIKDLQAKLEAVSFDISKIWIKKPTGSFKNISNQGNVIKLDK